jgi:heat shock protein HslJ
LAETSWHLVTFPNQGAPTPASPETSATLEFGPTTQISGLTGCNSFSGTYTTDGAALTIHLGAKTSRACTGTPLMEQEEAIVTHLQTVATYAITGDVLTLSDGSGAALFTYETGATTISGTKWTITGVNNGTGAVSATALTDSLAASFSTDNEFVGFGGCNKLSGPYTLADHSGVSIGPIAATRTTCGNAVDRLETQYVSALSHAAAYEISGTTLTLRDKNQAIQVTAQHA